MLENHGVPNGGAHVLSILALAESQRKAHGPLILKHAEDIKLLGICLCELYQAATCHRECFGPERILEGMAGRVYKHACACINLILSGYYDETLALVRSIGEIANLIVLSVYGPADFKEWLASDRRARMTRFSPKNVRRARAAHHDVPLVANDDWYATLSEEYIHVRAGQRPNMHNDERPIAGGIVQDRGFDLALDRLVEIVCYVTMFASRYVDHRDMFDEISACRDRYKAAKKSGAAPSSDASA